MKVFEATRFELPVYESNIVTILRIELTMCFGRKAKHFDVLATVAVMVYVLITETRFGGANLCLLSTPALMRNPTIPLSLRGIQDGTRLPAMGALFR
jgi:hypothetical protein